MTKRNRTGAGRGRPSASGKVRIVPIPHETPDARKLGRAFLALALHQAAQSTRPEAHESRVATDTEGNRERE